MRTILTTQKEQFLFTTRLNIQTTSQQLQVNVPVKYLLVLLIKEQTSAQIQLQNPASPLKLNDTFCRASLSVLMSLTLLNVVCEHVVISYYPVTNSL